MKKQVTIVTPWHNKTQFEEFCDAWVLEPGAKFESESAIIHFAPENDSTKQGCARTKNSGIEKAIRNGAEVIIILDDDCYPNPATPDAGPFVEDHLFAMRPQSMDMFWEVTEPPSRGTPFIEREMMMPVAASMGFWIDVGDYDAPSQLVYGARHPMEFKYDAVFGRYFPLCGMNLAFEAKWWPWCKFIDVPRYDDIWQGFLWQKKAYSMNYCFNLSGPVIRHVRQSNVWQNLKDESINAERNETIWRDIANAKSLEYEDLKKEVGLP